MTRPHRLAAATLALAMAASLSACNNDSPSDGAAAGPTERSEHTTTASEPTSPSTTSETQPSEPSEPTESTLSSAGSPTPTTHDNSSVRRAKKAQVALAVMPGFNADWVWDGAAGRAGVRPESPGSSRCMRASLTAIGGVVEYSTSYTVAGDAEDQAVLTTAVFPDEHTATMAESVLASWLGKCRAYLSHQPRVDSVAVTDDRSLSTSVGTGHHRLIGFGPVEGDPDSQYFNGEGYVRDGDVLSYLVMHSVGQDYNYADDQEPVVLGLQKAADALRASR
jgi:hypothetical protein